MVKEYEAKYEEFMGTKDNVPLSLEGVDDFSINSFKSYLNAIYTKPKMKVGIVNGLPQNERSKIWKIIAKVDLIKIDMLQKPEHAQFKNSEEVFHFYRD